MLKIGKLINKFNNKDAKSFSLSSCPLPTSLLLFLSVNLPKNQL